jgi:hypothetical protein
MTGIEPAYSSNRCGIRTSGVVVEVIGSVVADFPGRAPFRCYRKCCGNCRQEDRNRPSLKSGTYPSGDVYRVIGCADSCATRNATSPGPRNTIENAQLLDGSTSRQWGQKWSVTTPGPMSLTRPTPLVYWRSRRIPCVLPTRQLSRPVEDCDRCLALAGVRHLRLDDPRAIRPDLPCDFGAASHSARRDPLIGRGCQRSAGDPVLDGHQGFGSLDTRGSCQQSRSTARAPAAN